MKLGDCPQYKCRGQRIGVVKNKQTKLNMKYLFKYFQKRYTAVKLELLNKILHLFLCFFLAEYQPVWVI